MQPLFALLLIILSIIGIADSGFITYEEINNIVPPCGNGFNCEAVLTSRFAHIGPVSLANLGLLYYITMLVLAVLNYLDFDLQKIPLIKNSAFLKRIKLIDVLLLLSAGGFFFSLYLVSLMAFVIHAWCKYCLLSALSSTLLFIAVQFYHSKFSKQSSFFAKYITLQIIKFLYGFLGKPLLFLFNPELVHNTITTLGSFIGSIPPTKFLTKWLFNFEHPVLAKKVAGIQFINPVGLSAGYDTNGTLTGIMPAVGFGFQTIGTVTFESYAGNTKPRLGRYQNSKSLLVNKGYDNLGAAAVIKKLSTTTLHIPTGISIASTNKKFKSTTDQIFDIIKTFSLFEKSSIKHAFYELNINNPNTDEKDVFLELSNLKSLLSAIDKLKLKKPLFVKLPIDQSEKESLSLLKEIAAHKVDGLVIGYLTKDRTNRCVQLEDREDWKNTQGHLSGKPTFELSNYHISLAKKTYGKRFTIIGTGGIFNAEDAWEKITRGADLVQLITGMIYEGPQTIGLINRGLADKLLDKSTK